ncbi:MAG: hypothetical protein ABIZ80_12885 [Bryobacteraceae bacterium]
MPVKNMAKKKVKSAPKRPVRKVIDPPAVRNGRPASLAAPKPAPLTYIPASDLPNARHQYDQFEQAMQLFHKREFQQASELFRKATVGPSREVAANAHSHVRMCERRLAAPPAVPKSAEEYYNLGVTLMNARKLLEAKQNLEAALRLEPAADHVYYALAVSQALSGEVSGAYDSLKRAIELQPRNRNIARQDPDFDRYSDQPPLDGLLYPG